ncbi:MAG: hypothetical protein NT010_10555 [Proteobacteria bacterium]|nr:hypothetical protein [Pseudomonadota bacterium]
MSLRNKTTALTQEIEQQLSKGETNLEINLLTVEEFLRTSQEVIQLISHADKSGFSFEDYESGETSNSTSDIVTFCKKIGLPSISSLKTVIQESLEWSQSYLQNQRKASKLGWEVSPGFICTLILIRKFQDQFEVLDLSNLGWDKEVALRVLSIAKAKDH